MSTTDEDLAQRIGASLSDRGLPTTDDLRQILDAYDKAPPSQRQQAADDLANALSDYLGASGVSS